MKFSNRFKYYFSFFFTIFSVAVFLVPKNWRSHKFYEKIGNFRKIATFSCQFKTISRLINCLTMFIFLSTLKSPTNRKKIDSKRVKATVFSENRKKI